MLEERAKIVSIDDGSVWVETVQLSTCGSCRAQKGCGQSLLASLGAKPNYLRVLVPNTSTANFRPNQFVTIGLPENIVVNTSLLLYLVPLCLLLLCSAFAHTFYGNELFTIIMAVVGLCFGSLFIKYFSEKYQHDQRFQPVLLMDEEQVISFDVST